MKPKKPKMVLFLNHPECSAQCAVGMYEALSSHFDIDMFNVNQFKDKTFKKADIIAFPGGIGDSDTFYKLVGNNLNYIQDAVANGKKYLGICMGAYWAGNHYFDIVEDIKITQYIKRTTSDVKRSYGTTVPITWNDEEMDMYFYDGCTYVGDRSKFTTIAKYANNEPMAIIQNNIGLIGCHPESMKSWYDSKSMKVRWHENYHHKLLLDFTKLLMSY